MESIRTGRAIRLRPPQLHLRHPQPNQKIYKPARRKPKEINVEWIHSIQKPERIKNAKVSN